MLPDNIEHCIVFMNYWGVSGVFWSFSKCNITIPHLPADPSKTVLPRSLLVAFCCVSAVRRPSPPCFISCYLTNKHAVPVNSVLCGAKGGGLLLWGTDTVWSRSRIWHLHLCDHVRALAQRAAAFLARLGVLTAHAPT